MRKLRFSRSTRWLGAAFVLATGCTPNRQFSFHDSWNRAPSYHTSPATQIEYPNVKSCLEPEVANAPEPFRLENPADLPAREMLLDEAIHMALNNGEILRSLNASVVQVNPLGLQSKYSPAIAESDPNGGVEAALSAFDAQVASRLFWQVDDRPNNIAINPILSNFQRATFQQTGANFNYEISKRTATGASFAARHNIAYDLPNTPNRLFSSGFSGWFEAEYRQPLMRGAGVDYNRIAGPGSPNGQYRGVLIARINTDISLTDFEKGIITYINDVECDYWELYLDYNNLQ